jgi:hypothetical protein
VFSRGLEAFRETEIHDMKHPICTLACGAALLAAFAVSACSSNPTAASSASAYGEAEKKGVQISPGEHGGHSAQAGVAPAEGAYTDHAAMPGMDHSRLPGMEHGAPAPVAPPTSNAAIVAIQPATTLRPDEFDAPAATAVEEAAKVTSGMSHPMEPATPSAPPRHDHEQPQPTPKAPPQHDHKAPQPQPSSEHHHHGGGEAS